MADKYRATIDALEDELQNLEKEVTDIKSAINSLCRRSGIPERYSELETGVAPSISNIRGDQFYARPLATVVRECLAMRRSANLGPATVAELFEMLTQGGYEFNTKNVENAKRGLRISLTKNPVFHKLPSGQYGLTEWYPKAKEGNGTSSADTDEDDSEMDEQNGESETGDGSDAEAA